MRKYPNTPNTAYCKMLLMETDRVDMPALGMTNVSKKPRECAEDEYQSVKQIAKTHGHVDTRRKMTIKNIIHRAFTACQDESAIRLGWGRSDLPDPA